MKIVMNKKITRSKIIIGIRGVIFGFLIGLVVWLLVAVYMIANVGYTGLVNVVNTMLDKYEYKFYINIFILPIIFAIFGISINLLFNNLKNKEKTKANVFGSLALFVLLVLKVLNMFVGPIIGGPFTLVTIKNVVLRNVVIFGTGYFIGWLIGHYLDKKERIKNSKKKVKGKWLLNLSGMTIFIYCL